MFDTGTLLTVTVPRLDTLANNQRATFRHTVQHTPDEGVAIPGHPAQKPHTRRMPITATMRGKRQ